jgi:hypothetical protein
VEFRGLTEAKRGRVEGSTKNYFTHIVHAFAFTPGVLKLAGRHIGKLPRGSRTRKQKSGGNEAIASGAKTRDAPAHDPDFPRLVLRVENFRSKLGNLRNQIF